MKTRIICFGNDIMSDDGAGLHVAEGLRRLIDEGALEADLIESPVAGWDLLELLDGFDRVFLIESVGLEGQPPGTITRLSADQEGARFRLCSLREGDLPTALAVGRKLGHAMPDQVIVYTIQGQDLLTFGRELTPAVAAVIPEAVERIAAEVRAAGV